MHQLKIIIASTRPGRKGPLVAQWFTEIAKQNPDFEIEVLDLKEINLPFLDEPEHPRLQHYRHEHTKQWSRIISTADAYVVITPEYNFGFPATLKNAFDFLYKEWNHKPISFVSYGGLAAGTRSVQMLKQVVTALQMMPIAENVNIPFFAKHIDENGVFNGDDALQKSAGNMLAELARWATALKTLRDN